MWREAAIQQETANRGAGLVRVAGHFGEWIQGRLGPQGALVLVTVACPALHVTARQLSQGPLKLAQNRPILSHQVAGAFLDRIRAPAGTIRLNAEMPPGGGAGASTAALVALAGLSARRGASLAGACLAVEGASDPLMLPVPDAVVWAPRAGRVISSIAPLPRAEIVGGFWGATQLTDPADISFPDISDLVARLNRPCSLRDLAAIASESARRTTSLRGPDADPTEDLAREFGALGFLRGHTGSARGLIFAPGAVPRGVAPRLSAAGFSEILRFRTGHGE